MCKSREHQVGDVTRRIISGRDAGWLETERRGYVYGAADDGVAMDNGAMNRQMNRFEPPAATRHTHIHGDDEQRVSIK